MWLRAHATRAEAAAIPGHTPIHKIGEYLGDLNSGFGLAIRREPGMLTVEFHPPTSASFEPVKCGYPRNGLDGPTGD